MSNLTKNDKIKSENVKLMVKKRHKLPLFIYDFSNYLQNLYLNKNFFDTVLIFLAFLFINLSFPAYPILILIPLFIILSAVSIFHPYAGLIAFAVLSFPIAIIEFPLLAWLMLPIISLVLILGYMHYRSIILLFILVVLPFSPLGYLLEIPFLILTPLIIGFKRSAAVYAFSIISIVILSGILGISNTGFIFYNQTVAHSQIVSHYTLIAKYMVMSSNVRTSINSFIPDLSKSLGLFSSPLLTNNISSMFDIVPVALVSQITYLLEMVVFILIAFIIAYFATNIRSKYKGSISSIYGIGFPIVIVMFFIIFSIKTVSLMYITPFISFIIAPFVIYLLELYGINIVDALNVKKNDLRMKFGDTFEDLSTGMTNETFDDIADSEAVKEELKESIIAPLELKGISKAYNMTPIKGVLLFGPPGNGKTKLMRALSNEIHAGFYYLKAPTIISAYPGESEKKINNIFETAKKNVPCVLFIDEIDSIAASRKSETDDIHKNLLSQLLMEMDGFEKLDKVVVVAATNMPDKLDPAILRPGRLDKAIYMHLPDLNGRKEIFSMYLKGLPLAPDININALAEATPRYSGADIKSICETVSQVVGSKAAKEHKILEINQNDINEIIKRIHPSTTFAEMEEYNTFEMDFRRSRGMEPVEEADDNITIDNVVGLSDAKNAIVEAIQIPLMHPDLIKKYDIKSINGVLLFGPPGTGKTMLMKAIKGDFKGVNTLELDGADVEREGIEKANQTIKDLFSRALDNKPAIIFIDEIDGLIRSRDNSSEYSSQITSQLLQEMDGIRKSSGVVVVAATNRPNDLDVALLRAGRFDKLVYVPPPNPKERAMIFREYLINTPLADNFKFSKLANETRGFTGADIYGICREVKMRALERDIKTGNDAVISYKDVMNVIVNTKPSASEGSLNSYLNFLSRYGRA